MHIYFLGIIQKNYTKSLSNDLASSSFLLHFHDKEITCLIVFNHPIVSVVLLHQLENEFIYLRSLTFERVELVLIQRYSKMLFEDNDTVRQVKVTLNGDGDEVPSDGAKGD